MKTTFKELAKISEHNLYRLIVDGTLHQREEGWHKYAQRENGCLPDVFQGLAFGLQDIENKELSTVQIKAIHGHITNKLLGQHPKEYGVLSGGYRPYSTYFGLSADVNITESGFKNLMQTIQEYKQKTDEGDKLLGGRFILDTPGPVAREMYNETVRNLPEVGGSEEEVWTAILLGSSLGKRVYYKAPEPELVSELMEAYVASYNEQIKLALSDEEKLGIIVGHIQKIEQLHPFQDGNLRVSIVLLQRLLIQNNFYPVMLREPNIFDGYDIDTLIGEVIEGMQNTKRIIENPGEELFGFRSIPFDDDLKVFNTTYHDAIMEMRKFHQFAQQASDVLSITDGNTLANEENTGHARQVPTCSTRELVSQDHQTYISAVQDNDLAIQEIQSAIASYLTIRNQGPNDTNILNLGYSKTEEMEAAHALLNALSGQPIDSKYIKVLENGQLSELYNRYKLLSHPAYIELLSILKSGDFVEHGVRLKKQFYPNLHNLIDAVEQFKDIAVIKAIAEKGIELNMKIREENPKRDPEQLNNRLAIFQAVQKANTIEELLGIINHEYPHLIKNKEMNVVTESVHPTAPT